LQVKNKSGVDVIFADSYQKQPMALTGTPAANETIFLGGGNCIEPLPVFILRRSLNKLIKLVVVVLNYKYGSKGR